MSNVRPGADEKAKVDDCTKQKLDEIDLIPRTLKCEVEIFNYDDKLSFTSVEGQGGGAEEEEIPIPTTEDGTDDEDQVNRSINALDCVIQRIELTQLQVEKRKQKKGTERVAASMDTLSFEEKMQICDLQHDHYNLQCEIDKVNLYYEELSRHLNEGTKLMCDLEREVGLVNDIAQEYKDWADETVDQELSVCHSRNKELNNIMITKKEVMTVTKAYEESAFKRSSKCLKKRLITDEVDQFHAAMSLMEQLADELKVVLENRYAKIHEMVNAYMQVLESPKE